MANLFLFFEVSLSFEAENFEHFLVLIDRRIQAGLQHRLLQADAGRASQSAYHPLRPTVSGGVCVPLMRAHLTACV